MYGLSAQAQVVCTPPGSSPFELSLPNFPWLTSLEIDVQMRTIMSIAIGIDVPYDQAIELLSYRSKVFIAGTLVQCRIGYPGDGQWTEWYRGVLNGADNALTIGPAGITGTLTANPFGMGYGDFMEKSLENVPTLKLLELAAEKMGCALFAWPDAASLLVSRVEEAVVLGARSPYQLLEEYTRKNGCWYWNAPQQTSGKNTIMVATRAEIQRQPPSLQVAIRGSFGMGGSIAYAPLLSFEPEMSAATWQYAQGDSDIGRGLSSYAVNMGTGEVIVSSVSASDLDEQTGAKSQAVTTPADKKVANTQVNRQQNRQRAQKAVPVDPLKDPEIQLKNKITVAGNVGLSADLTLLGTPIDYTGRIVRVVGVGERFTGNYWILKQRHSFSDGEWTTTLTGHNDGQYANVLSGDGESRKGGANVSEVPLDYTPAGLTQTMMRNVVGPR